MKIAILLILFYCSAIICFSQDTITLNYNNNFNLTTVKDSVKYFRKLVYINNKNIYESVDYYISGKLLCKGQYKDKDCNIAVGKFVSYYESGVKESEKSYNEEGKPDGELIRYYSNGKVKQEGKYKNGLKVGTWVKYFASGKKNEENKYNDEGNLHGTTTEWYKNGNVKTSGEYNNGTKEGIWIKHTKFNKKTR